MKRSEMLRLIANTIYNNTYRSSMLETLPLAETVLLVIEQSGMKPPKVQVKRRSVFTDDEGNTLFDEMISVPANEWEPEE